MPTTSAWVALSSLALARHSHADTKVFADPLQESLDMAAGVTMGPWTHTQECVEVDDSEFCLFTNSEFGDGRGISFITSATAVDKIQWVQTVTNSTILDRLNRNDDLPFRATAIPGSGLGLVAERTIAKGELITAWTPLLVVDDEASRSVPWEQLEKLQDLAVDRMSKEWRSMFLAQHAQFGGHQVTDIMKTNAFVFDGIGGMDGRHVASFPEASRFNHACRPNVEYNFDKESMGQYTFATRTIHPGEELTISYTDTMLPRHERLYDLNKQWGFRCSCSHCSRTLVEIDQSDQRVQRILDIVDECKNEWADKKKSCTLDKAVELVLLYEQENTGGMILAWAYWQAMLASTANGLEEMANKYEELALGNTRGILPKQ